MNRTNRNPRKVNVALLTVFSKNRRVDPFRTQSLVSVLYYSLVGFVESCRKELSRSEELVEKCAGRASVYRNVVHRSGFGGPVKLISCRVRIKIDHMSTFVFKYVPDNLE